MLYINLQIFLLLSFWWTCRFENRYTLYLYFLEIKKTMVNQIYKILGLLMCVLENVRHKWTFSKSYIDIL